MVFNTAVQRRNKKPFLLGERPKINPSWWCILILRPLLARFAKHCCIEAQFRIEKLLESYSIRILLLQSSSHSWKTNVVANVIPFASIWMRMLFVEFFYFCFFYRFHFSIETISMIRCTERKMFRYFRTRDGTTNARIVLPKNTKGTISDEEND